MDLGKLHKYRSWLISAAIAAIVGLWLLSGVVFPSSKDDTSADLSADASKEEITSVRVRTLTAEPVRRTIVVNGKTAPARIANIAAETDGRVTTIGADRGSNLSRGDLILRLDQRDRHARLAQAKATLKQREVEFEAREKLKSSSYVSEAQLQEAVAALETARTEVMRAELDLAYMTVRAPFNGALQERLVEQGDFVSVGDPVATYVDNRTMIVTANVSEFDAQYVAVDDIAEARLATGETVQGRIRYVAPVADESTRTFAVELEVDNSKGSLRAGGTAELRLNAETVLAHQLSPALLTLDDNGNVGVKIINADDEVEFIDADIALTNAAGVWIAGLPETATIITVGQGFVSAGTSVNAIPEDEVPTAVAVKDQSK